MGGGHRVIVGHIQQHQAIKVVFVVAVENGLAPNAAVRVYPQKVQQGGGVVAPSAGGGTRGGGAAGTHVGKIKLG